MKTMKKYEQAQYLMRGKKLLADFEKNPSRIKNLIKLLKDNGFEDVADILRDLANWYMGDK